MPAAVALRAASPMSGVRDRTGRGLLFIEDPFDKWGAGERKPGRSDGASLPGGGEDRRALWAVGPSGMIASMITNRKAHAA